MCHYIIGETGAALMAAERQDTLPSREGLRIRRNQLGASPQLQHRVGANEFFIQLFAHTRTYDNSHLVQWLNTKQTDETYPPYTSRVHCDGHGLWREGDRTVAFYLEHDTGTESRTVLLEKIAAYEEAVVYKQMPAHPVLFWMHSALRERNFHDALARQPGDLLVPVATASRDAQTTGCPADRVWTLAGAPRRHRLSELPAASPQPGGMMRPASDLFSDTKTMRKRIQPC
jgi:hypothetical protein